MNNCHHAYISKRILQQQKKHGFIEVPYCVFLLYHYEISGDQEICIHVLGEELLPIFWVVWVCRSKGSNFLDPAVLNRVINSIHSSRTGSHSGSRQQLFRIFHTHNKFATNQWTPHVTCTCTFQGFRPIMYFHMFVQWL